MQASTELKKRVGEIMGMVTCQKRRSAVAPSMDAASYNSCGMPCKPARKMTIMLPPIAPHSATRPRLGSAHDGSVNHNGPLKPVPVRKTPICHQTSFNNPYCGFSSHNQI